jgi:hypothetical protein
MSISPSLVAQPFAFFVICFLELNAIGFCYLNQLGSGGLQQFSVSGVSYGFRLHGGIQDRAYQFFLGDELESNRHFDDAGKHFLHYYFAKCFAKAPQLCRITRPLVLEILVA